MKKVKFNVTSTVHMIPDEEYAAVKQSMHEIRFKTKEKAERLLAGSDFEHKDVKIDDVVEVPDWYYEAHKNDEVEISISIKNYRDRITGEVRPFDTNDAIMHNYLEMPADGGVPSSMKKVKRFELVVAKK